MAYIGAFFHGVPCKLAGPGTKFTEKVRGKVSVKAELPNDFAATHSITAREYQGVSQLNATEINKAMRQYKVDDTFCVVGMSTDLDLYPCDDEHVLENMQYVYGLADPDSLCSVVSLRRHKLA